MQNVRKDLFHTIALAIIFLALEFGIYFAIVNEML